MARRHKAVLAAAGADVIFDMGECRQPIAIYILTGSPGATGTVSIQSSPNAFEGHVPTAAPDWVGEMGWVTASAAAGSPGATALALLPVTANLLVVITHNVLALRIVNAVTLNTATVYVVEYPGHV